MKEATKIHKKNALNSFVFVLEELSFWKGESDKDYKTLKRIYYKLLGKKTKT